MEVSGAKSPWILGPKLDLLFCCGGLVWLLVGATYLARRLGLGAQATQWALSLGVVLTLLFSNAHTMATWVRMYRMPEGRRTFPFHMVHLPILMVLLGAAAFALGWLPPVLGKIYLYWNAFHWCGQAYGIAMIYCLKRDFKLRPVESRLLWWAINSAAFVYVLRLTAYKDFASEFLGVRMPFWGPIPKQAVWLGELGAAWVVVAFLGFIVYKRVAEGQRFPAPALMVAATGFLAWASWGKINEILWLYLVPLYHGSQYIAVSSAYYLKEGAPMPRDGAALLWSRKAALYLGLLVLGGLSIYKAAPAACRSLTGAGAATALLVITCVVNFHHFLTDQAIWKLRDAGVRETLLS